jgi:hypothetical protein
MVHYDGGIRRKGEVMGRTWREMVIGRIGDSGFDMNASV